MKRLLVVYLLTLTGLFACKQRKADSDLEEGSEGGNGGNFVVCANPQFNGHKAILYDFYYGMHEKDGHGLKLKFDDIKVPASVKESLTDENAYEDLKNAAEVALQLVARIKDLDPDRYGFYVHEIEQLSDEGKTKLGWNLDMPQREDKGAVVRLPSGCERKQVGYFHRPRNLRKNDREFNIDLSYWSLADIYSKAGLLLHEIGNREIRWMRMETTEATQDYLAFLAAGSFKEYSKSKYGSFVKNSIGLPAVWTYAEPTYELQGVNRGLTFDLSSIEENEKTISGTLTSQGALYTTSWSPIWGDLTKTIYDPTSPNPHKTQYTSVLCMDKRYAVKFMDVRSPTYVTLNKNKFENGVLKVQSKAPIFISSTDNRSHAQSAMDLLFPIAVEEVEFYATGACIKRFVGRKAKDMQVKKFEIGHITVTSLFEKEYLDEISVQATFNEKGILNYLRIDSPSGSKTETQVVVGKHEVYSIKPGETRNIRLDRKD